MFTYIKEIIVGVLLAVLAFLKPVEAELWTLFLIFFLNFCFGYLSGMIANNEEWDYRKALRCVGEAAIFFVLVVDIYIYGVLKQQEQGALQCISFITYVVTYFYGLNILRNLKKIFKEGTTPWYVVAFLYYILRFKFIEKIPFLSEFLNINRKEVSDGTAAE